MRIVLDVSILVRAQKGTGPARAVLVELLDRGHQLVLSASVLEELERICSYPRIRKRFGLNPDAIEAYVHFLEAAAEIVAVDEALIVPIRDPKDAHILQTAVSGGAKYVCTLDEHFFEPAVRDFSASCGMTVLTDVDLLQLIRGSG